MKDVEKNTYAASSKRDVKDENAPIIIAIIKT